MNMRVRSYSKLFTISGNLKTMQLIFIIRVY